jgi:predicted nucleotidyltransferase
MDMTGELKAIVDRLNRDNARAAAQAAEAQRNAFIVARELAEQMGAEDPSLRRVILFGSTVPGRRYRVDSDIDLAIDGGDRTRLERLAMRIPQTVDIIEIDDLRPGIRDRVLTEGVVLYEAR